MTITDGAAQVLVFLAGAGVVAVVTAIWRLYAALATFRLHVAENYLKREGLQEVKNEVKEIRTVVFSIAGKLGVNIKADGGS